MRTWNWTAVIVVPKQRVLDWLHAVDPTSAEITIENLRKEPAVYPLAESESNEHAEKLLTKSCARIFEEPLGSGHAALALATHCRLVVAIDLSFEMLRLTSS
jgi:methylase of polypeptide subunit release factors